VRHAGGGVPGGGDSGGGRRLRDARRPRRRRCAGRRDRCRPRRAGATGPPRPTRARAGRRALRARADARRARGELPRGDAPGMSDGRPALLYVIDNLEFGGGERGFLQLAEALRDRYRIAFACEPGGVLGERLPALGVALHPISFRRRFSLRAVEDLRAVIRAERIDLVHSMGARAAVGARLASRFAGVPVVSTIAMLAERFEVSRPRRLAYRVVSRTTERLCRGLIAESDAIRTTLIHEHGLPASRVTRIYRGV